MVWVESRLGPLKVNVQALPFDTYFNELNASGDYYSVRGLAEDPEGRIYTQYYSGIVRFDPAKNQPSEFIRSFRLAKAKSLLETSGLNVSEVGWQVGYRNPAHFSKSFQDKFGFSPSALRG